MKVKVYFGECYSLFWIVLFHLKVFLWEPISFVAIGRSRKEIYWFHIVCVEKRIRKWKSNKKKRWKRKYKVKIFLWAVISSDAAVPLEEVERKFIDFRLCLLRRESVAALLPGSVKSFKRKEAPEPSEKVSFCKSTNDRSRKLERDAWTRKKKYISLLIQGKRGLVKTKMTI